MIREFIELVDEAVDTGYAKGVNLFMENLESDIKSNTLMEGVTENDVVKNLFINEGYTLDEELENIDESVLDQALVNVGE